MTLRVGFYAYKGMYNCPVFPVSACELIDILSAADSRKEPDIVADTIFYSDSQVNSIFLV